MKTVSIVFAFLVLLTVVVHSQNQTNVATPSSNIPLQAASTPTGTPQMVQLGTTAPSDNLYEFVYRQIDMETKRLDSLIQNAERVGALMVVLVIAFATIVTVLGYRSMKELKDELRSSVESIVDGLLKDKSKQSENFASLVSKLAPAVERWAVIKSNIDSLEAVEEKSASQSGDAKGAYHIAKGLSEKDSITADDRRTALSCLRKNVKLGEEGQVDPQLLFNASGVASDMDFDHQALELGSLCAHWAPKPSYILRKNRLEDIFGMRFELKEKALVQTHLPPTSVRQEAWIATLKEASKSPTDQCELIYSEFQNIAIRNRESGYIDQAIEVIRNNTIQNATPSYAYVILSDLYAMRGNSTWLTDYLETVGRAANILAKESPACTWYESSIQDTLKMATLVNKNAEIQKILVNAGITISNQPAKLL